MTNESLEPSQLHAYVDGELAPEEVVRVERALASRPEAAAEVAVLRAQKSALHARYDHFLTAPHRLSVEPRRAWSGRGSPGWWWPFGGIRTALAAMLIVGFGIGLAIGWFVHDAAIEGRTPVAADARLDAFARTAALSHAVYAPEVRHPVEVGADQEAHLVAWLSKRLDAPVTVPHLGDAGWHLLGGRLLAADVGPVAQFMYQDARGRRLTLAVSHSKTALESSAAPGARGEFRIAEDRGNTVFYWIEARYAYAMTGPLTRDEMTGLAERVYKELDR